MDGLGMGADGELWGGEFLLADYRDYRRLGALDAVSLLGGAQAMREPWRNTLAHLLHYFDWDELAAEYASLELMQFLQHKPVSNLKVMRARQLNSPPCSSAGRLFDAVAAALGLSPERISYESQAAMMLEALAVDVPAADAYPLAVSEYDGEVCVTWKPMWSALLNDLRDHVDQRLIAARFHATVIDGLGSVGVTMCEANKLTHVVLCGGVLHNRHLNEGLQQYFSARGIDVLVPHSLPAGDGAISLGQALVASARRSVFQG